MSRWLARIGATLGRVALAVDAGNAVRHGLPVSERARQRCAPRRERRYVPHTWSANGARETAPPRG